MKHLSLLVASLLLSAAALAQQALGPGTGLVSPEINPDHSVTFRLFAPKARTVEVTGDFLPVPFSMRLTARHLPTTRPE